MNDTHHNIFTKFHSFITTIVAILGWILLLSASATISAQNSCDTINLAGTWRFQLPYAPDTIVKNGYLTLPGTLDTNGIGIPNPKSESSEHPKRHVSFIGQAIYSREIEIPQHWDGEKILLKLERTRPASVDIDGQNAGMQNIISAPQIYDLSDFLSPGKHTITITVDNGRSIPETVRNNSHSCSESTQTNWNGILGEIILKTSNPDSPLPPVNLIDKERKFKVQGQQFSINGQPIFLRGTVDACVWPQTGHPPMDITSWRRYFETLRNYGLNHVRFHTWCPPEAAFAAADEMGFYLQPELPLWGELDAEQDQLLQFLEEETEAIVNTYGHHQSFVMFSLGNELWGDTNIMRRLADKARSLQPDLLVNFGSNVYLGTNGYMDGEDFLTASRMGNSYADENLLRRYFPSSDIIGGGPANGDTPALMEDYSHAIGLSPVPTIAHEVGQYQIYPDFNDTVHYTGILRPDNLLALKNKAESTGVIALSDAMHIASGHWAEKLYKAETEKALSTPGMGGFHLQAIQDYPGQGTATVGLIDVSGYPKKFTSPDNWRRSCADMTILASIPTVCLEGGTIVNIPIKTTNYSDKPFQSKSVSWSTYFDSGELKTVQGYGVQQVGIINLQLPTVNHPRKFELNLRLPEDSVDNTYSLWVYPHFVTKPQKNVTLTSSLEEAMKLLSEGGRVVYCPDSLTTAKTSVGPLFPTNFWTWQMYSILCDRLHKEPSPGTLGLLIDNPNHPVFDWFPSDNHTDWQWQSVVHASRPLVINRLPSTINPIVRVIDNPERSWRLALMMEFNVGKGRVLVLSADLEKLRQSLEGNWLLESACRYVSSKKFKPTVTLTPMQFKTLLSFPTSIID